MLNRAPSIFRWTSRKASSPRLRRKTKKLAPSWRPISCKVHGMRKTNLHRPWNSRQWKLSRSRRIICRLGFRSWINSRKLFRRIRSISKRMRKLILSGRRCEKCAPRPLRITKSCRLKGRRSKLLLTSLRRLLKIEHATIFTQRPRPTSIYTVLSRRCSCLKSHPWCQKLVITSKVRTSSMARSTWKRINCSPSWLLTRQLMLVQLSKSSSRNRQCNSTASTNKW